MALAEGRPDVALREAIVAKMQDQPPADDSLNRLIGGLKRADRQAAESLWIRYFDKLVRLARRRMNGAPRQMADEEDVALSVFKSLCLRAARGEFDQLHDRDDLWRILVTITCRKAAAAARREGRFKRKRGRLGKAAFELVPSGEPSPATLASLNEEQQRLLAILPDETCRCIARWKLEGETDEEIASRLDVVERTVRRKTRLIRVIWEEDLARSAGC